MIAKFKLHLDELKVDSFETVTNQQTKVMKEAEVDNELHKRTLPDCTELTCYGPGTWCGPTNPMYC